MNRNLTPALAALALVTHPLLVISLLVGFDGVVAYLLELILAAGLTTVLVPWIPGTGRRGGQRTPETVEVTLDGFRADFALPVDVGRHFSAGLLGLVLSSAGLGVVGFVALIVAGARSVGGLDAEMLMIVLVGGLLLHLFLQTFPMGAFLAGRASHASRSSKRSVQLAGRVLRVEGESMALTGAPRLTHSVPDGSLSIEDDGKRLLVWASRPELEWLAERIREVEAQGSAEDVPEGLARVRSAQPVG